MKTIKDLKDGDILWFVQGTIIKETIVKNFHIKELEVIKDLHAENWEYVYKPHYCFETWLDDKLQYNFYEEAEEYGNEPDTATKYADRKDYSWFCHFVNKKDAIKYLKKNIRAEIRNKHKMINNINKDIETLEKQLNSL